jgi:AcrR family transcriptional regulator
LGRRSDHSRVELRAMILAEGHRQIAEVGYARFSARDVAKRIGYSVGTLYNVFGSHDALILAINGITLDRWREYLGVRLDGVAANRLRVAIEAYFEFAIINRNAWTALYDFRLSDPDDMTDDYAARLTAIFDIVIAEVAAELPEKRRDEAPALARSLLATVHGHCFFTLNGTFALLDETDPLGAAYARVREAITLRNPDPP